MLLLHSKLIIYLIYLSLELFVKALDVNTLDRGKKTLFTAKKIWRTLGAILSVPIITRKSSKSYQICVILMTQLYSCHLLHQILLLFSYLSGIYLGCSLRLLNVSTCYGTYLVIVILIFTVTVLLRFLTKNSNTISIINNGNTKMPWQFL